MPRAARVALRVHATAHRIWEDLDRARYFYPTTLAETPPIFLELMDRQAQRGEQALRVLERVLGPRGAADACWRAFVGPRPED